MIRLIFVLSTLLSVGISQVYTAACRKDVSRVIPEAITPELITVDSFIEKHSPSGYNVCVCTWLHDCHALHGFAAELSNDEAKKLGSMLVVIAELSSWRDCSSGEASCIDALLFQGMSLLVDCGANVSIRHPRRRLTTLEILAERDFLGMLLDRSIGAQQAYETLVDKLICKRIQDSKASGNYAWAEKVLMRAFVRGCNLIPYKLLTSSIQFDERLIISYTPIRNKKKNKPYTLGEYLRMGSDLTGYDEKLFINLLSQCKGRTKMKRRGKNSSLSRRVFSNN